jgi:mannose-6-phosphate isomerase-like protein (cupin superfamily)
MKLFRLTERVIEMPEKDSAGRIIRSADANTAKTAILHITPNPANEAMRFYSHNNAYAAFVVWTGCFLFFNGDKTEELHRGDFIFIPPGTVYGYHSLMPGSELLVLTTLEDPTAVLETINEEQDEPIDWNHSLSTFLRPYSLNATTCPRWIFGGVITRPFVRQAQCEGKFSISAMETSRVHRVRPFLDRWLYFTSVDHLFCVVEGTMLIKLKGQTEWTELREGQAMLISARQAFTADVGSEFVKILTVTNGIGIDELICRAGREYGPTTLPETTSRWDTWDELRLRSACSEVGALLDY